MNKPSTSNEQSTRVRSATTTWSFGALIRQRLASSRSIAATKPTMRDIMWILGSLLGHATASSIVSLVVMYIASLGLVATGQSPTNQSYSAFMVGVALCTTSVYVVIYLLIQSSLLATARFLVAPGKPLGVVFCVKRLARAVWPYYILQEVLTLSTCTAFSDSAPVSWRQFRIQNYILMICGMITMAGIHIETVKIYKTETVQGTTRAKDPAGQQQQQPLALVIMMPRTVVVFVAASFVQIANLFQYTTSHSVMMYLLVGFVVKLSTQELVRSVLLRAKVNDTRTMFAATAISTVLIDTQVSILLQQLGDAWITVSGTVGMSILEIITRAVCVIYVRRRLRKKPAPTRATTIQIVPIAPAVQPNLRHEMRETEEAAATQQQQEEADEHRRCRRILAMHAAEMYAEMSAEYIAMGSSAAILFLGWSHPRYMMGAARFAATTATDPSQSHGWQSTSIFALQVAMELVEDFISCSLEIRNGVDFEPLRRYGTFVLAFLTCVSVLNVQITMVMYMKTEDHIDT